jgi:primase-polymerase (primpol)-like protein
VTGLLDVRPAAIPDELMSRPQWLPWRFEMRDGRRTKLPLDVHTGWPAKWGTMSTLQTFEVAQRAQTRLAGDGLGFIFRPENGLTVVDLDALSMQELGIVRALSSYTERSPTGRGVHVIVAGSKPGPHCRSNSFPTLEIYDGGRFCSITGHMCFLTRLQRGQSGSGRPRLMRSTTSCFRRRLYSVQLRTSPRGEVSNRQQMTRGYGAGCWRAGTVRTFET